MLILFFALIILLPCLGPAQTHRIQFDRLSTDEGLSYHKVTCILQDSWGFIWVGTFDGLNRYDGYKFTFYKNDSNDTTSISSNWIEEIIEDKDKTLWIGTRGGGLNRFNRDTETFTHWKHDPNNPNSLSHNEI